MKKAAKILGTKKEELMQAWLEKVRGEVAAAGQNEALVLRDHLPHLLEDLVTIMTRYEKFDVLEEEAVYEEIFENSIEHGRHRASTAGYTLDQILREYIAFHRVVTDELMSQDSYSTEVGMVLKYSIENAMLYSGMAFNQSMQEMRQKMIGFLAHDLRNPISAAYMALGYMKYEDGEERFEMIRQMARSGLKRSLGMVEDLLDSISVEAGEGITLEFAEVDLMEVVTSVYDEASEIYSNHIILEGEEEELVGIFDATMIRRVLENFLSNAIKYGDRDHPVTIKVQQTEQDLTIRVNNSGNPIPDERKEEIFRFLNTTGFHTGVKSLKSWGMGLSLIKAVAEAHNGKLEVESNEQEGTTFSIFLEKYRNKPGKTKAAITYNIESNQDS